MPSIPNLPAALPLAGTDLVAVDQLTTSGTRQTGRVTLASLATALDQLDAAGAPTGSTSGPSTARPANPAAGTLYFDTTLGQLMVWTGLTWAGLLASGAGPAPAAALSVGTVTTSAIPLSWIASTTAGVSYQPQYRVSGSTAWIAYGNPLTTLSTTFIGLSAATIYDVSVLTIGPTGSTLSNVVMVATAGIVPAAVTGLTVTALETSANVSWTASASGAPTPTYQLNYRVHGTTPWTPAYLTIAGVAETVTGLTAATQYDFQVVATNSAGSAASSIVSATTSTASVSAPTTPVLTVGTVSTNSVALSWTASTNAADYRVYYQTPVSTGSFVAFGPALTTTSVTVTGLSAGTAYGFKIVAENSVGTAPSTVQTGTTTSAAPAPSGSVSGTQTSGTVAPIVTGPANGTVTASSVLPLTGISISDAAAAASAGTCTTNVFCASGTLTCTLNGSAVPGSGTASFAISDTLANTNSALATLTYTAGPNVGSDSVSINPWDQAGANSTLVIPITVQAAIPNGGNGGVIDVTSPRPGTDTTGTTAYRIADMLDRFGVNVYPMNAAPGTSDSTGLVAYNSGGSAGNYSKEAAAAAINWLTGGTGLKMNCRVYHWNADGTGPNYQTTLQSSWIPWVANATGAKFTICLAAGAGASEVSGMVSIAQASATAPTQYVVTLEGCNEPNVFGVSEPNALAAQEAVWNNGHAISGVQIAQTPIAAVHDFKQDIIDFCGSDIGTFPTYASINNVHFYPQTEPSQDDGHGQYGQLGWALYATNTAYGINRKAILTEYHPTLYWGDDAHKVDHAYDAYFAPMFLLLAYIHYDVQAIYWWSLFDYDEAGYAGTGLFPSDVNNPTLAAYALRAMYQLTGDPNPSQKYTFAPGKLNYTVAGLPPVTSSNAPYSGGQTALFQNSAGTYFLFVWNAQNTPGAASVPVTINFPSHAMTSVTDYCITKSGANQTPAQAPISNCSTITVQLGTETHLLVIEY